MHKNEASNERPSMAAIIVAGGAGQRAGGQVPKQFQRLGGRPLLLWSVEVCAASPQVDRVVIVVPAIQIGRLGPEFDALQHVSVVSGGTDRSASVRAGLAALADDAPDQVLIHDAARPGLSLEMISRLAAALASADAAAPALPMADAIKRVSGDRIETVDREGLVRVQTPQAFRYPLIVEAYAAGAASAVDDLALVEASSRVALVDGDPALMKITYPGDMEQISRLLLQQDVRIGAGFDVHAFSVGDHVTLCGVRIGHSRGLAGHSDADVGWHALTDAILGAMALGDIGEHFPPSDPQWKGADSAVFLSHAIKLAAERGYRVNNADVTLICEAPKIGPHRETMRSATAEVLGVSIERVSVKATTTEKLGFTGRGEGVAAQACVTLVGGV